MMKMKANLFAVRRELWDIRVKSFNDALSNMPIKKKDREAMVDGFKSGFTDAINQLVEMGLIHENIPEERK